jgi:outer membrane lipoprotein-sorting protein
MNLILVAALLLQDKTAEETFKKIEAVVQNAKTLQVAFTVFPVVTSAVKQTQGKCLANGMLFLKETDKVLFTVTDFTQQEPKVSGVSLFRTSLDHNLPNPAAVVGLAPGALRLGISHAFCQGGIQGVLGWLRRSRLPAKSPAPDNRNPSPKNGPQEDPERGIRVSGFEIGEGGARLKSLSYIMTIADLKESSRVTVWYDPESLKPVKRSISTGAGEGAKVIMETYTQYFVDQGIPDDQFRGEHAPDVESFKNLEKAILEAKTLHAKFTCDFTIGVPNKSEKGTFTAEVDLKQGNKVRLAIQGRSFTETGKPFVQVSDGEKVSKEGIPLGGWKEPARIFHDFLAGSMAGPGIMVEQIGLGVPRAPDQEPNFRFRYFDIEAGQVDKGAKTLAYKCESDGAFKLWYDPKGFRLLKRSVSFTFMGVVITAVESYDEFALNSDISDENFKLPPTAPVGKPDVYPGTDVVEPKEFELKRALGMKKTDGLLETGTLEYGGAGDLAKIYDAYVKEMESVGWQGVANDSGNDKRIGTLRKGERICTIEFTKVATGIQAVINVGPGK